MDNLSAHSPIFCKIKTQLLQKITSSPSLSNKSPNPSWKNAIEIQKQKYFNDVSKKLQELEIPKCVTTCKDPHCKNDMHKTSLDNLMLDILSSM